MASCWSSAANLAWSPRIAHSVDRFEVQSSAIVTKSKWYLDARL